MNFDPAQLVGIADQQFRENVYKNIFCTAENQLHFTQETVDTIQRFGGRLRDLSGENREAVLQGYADRFIRTFLQTDPYINFSNEDKLLIQHIYFLLLHDIARSLPIAEIEKRHYERVRWLIKKTNPAVFQGNVNTNIRARRFVYAEYSPGLQLDLLGLDCRLLAEPILDIGCGEHGRLIEHFRSLGLEAYGLDCATRSGGYYHEGNWLEFSYGRNAWGTVISHLAFSSHFLHCSLQDDGLDMVYAQTYMKILESLVRGGNWVYTPSLPLIETLLPQEEYSVDRTSIGSDFYRTVITRL